MLPLATALVGPLQGENLALAPRTHTISDGFDRPVHVRLSDGNSYAFAYRLTKIAPTIIRHRTISRDARCVPTVFDRDERGLIRAVHEFMNAGPGSDFDAHAVGSTSNATEKTPIVALGWVKSIDDGDSHQQTMACTQGEASMSAAPGSVSPIVGVVLSDPFDDLNGRRRRNSTIYEFDALNQLVGVHLPKATSVGAGAPIQASGNLIRISYDGFGRRVSTDDPDRGFERLSYDLLANLTCIRSGPNVSTAAEADNRNKAFDRERGRHIPQGDFRLFGEDACLAPENAVPDHIGQVIRYDYLYDRLTKVLFRYPSPRDQDRKTISIDYGRSDDIAGNRAGRQIKLTDVTGGLSTTAYHPIGMPEKVERTLVSLSRSGAASVTIGTLRVLDTYDTWGLLNRSNLSGDFAGLRRDGTNDYSPARSTAINEGISYRYASSDQINEIRVGLPCPVSTDGTENCKNISPPICVVADAAFDERGNLVREAFGNGVVTRNVFDKRSNRLVASSARIGVLCLEFGPEDDCSTSSPPILFQNLPYQYDAAGNLLSHNNLPQYSDPCPDLRVCPPISIDHKKIMGLLVSKSENEFSYDERGRLKNVAKKMSLVGRTDRLEAASLRAARSAELNVAESFAFTDFSSLNWDP